MEYLSKSEAETAKIAVEFVQQLAPNTGGATVLGLYGELGAGKSVFARGLAKYLGVSENVQSPTFVIMKSYKLQVSSYRFQVSSYKLLVHIDAYRLEKAEELEVLGWKDILAEKNNLVVVEWAERVEDILPEDSFRINFEHISDTERKIKVANL